MTLRFGDIRYADRYREIVIHFAGKSGKWFEPIWDSIDPYTEIKIVSETETDICLELMVF